MVSLRIFTAVFAHFGRFLSLVGVIFLALASYGWPLGSQGSPGGDFLRFLALFWMLFWIDLRTEFDAILERIYDAACRGRTQFHPVNNGTEWTYAGLALDEIG